MACLVLAYDQLQVTLPILESSWAAPAPLIGPPPPRTGRLNLETSL